jgi:hypothetical protein
MACIADPNSMKCDAEVVVEREGRPSLGISPYNFCNKGDVLSPY